MNKNADNAWSIREFQQEYQYVKNRLDYEYNKHYHGPITKEVSDLQEEFELLSQTKKEVDLLDSYEERQRKWAQANPEQAAQLNNKRAANKAKWDDGWRPGHENVKAGVNEAAEHAMRQEMAEEASKNLRKSTMKNFGHLMNIGFAISDYKDAKEAGHSTTKSLAKAGMEFVKGEMLGGWYPVAMLAKSAPTLAVSAIEGLNSMSRDMNSMSRRQVFGDTYFQDTQQLATMRQSGMELAKMSQYNLQQTLMGNEAEHLHRL